MSKLFATAEAATEFAEATREATAEAAVTGVAVAVASVAATATTATGRVGSGVARNLHHFLDGNHFANGLVNHLFFGNDVVNGSHAFFLDGNALGHVDNDFFLNGNAFGHVVFAFHFDLDALANVDDNFFLNGNALGHGTFALHFDGNAFADVDDDFAGGSDSFHHGAANGLVFDNSGVAGATAATATATETLVAELAEATAEAAIVSVGSSGCTGVNSTRNSLADSDRFGHGARNACPSSDHSLFRSGDELVHDVGVGNLFGNVGVFPHFAFFGGGDKLVHEVGVRNLLGDVGVFHHLTFFGSGHQFVDEVFKLLLTSNRLVDGDFDFAGRVVRFHHRDFLSGVGRPARSSSNATRGCVAHAGATGRSVSSPFVTTFVHTQEPSLSWGNDCEGRPDDSAESDKPKHANSLLPPLGRVAG